MFVEARSVRNSRNIHKDTGNWREGTYGDNILATMRDLAAPLQSIATTPEAGKFGYKKTVSHPETQK